MKRKNILIVVVVVVVAACAVFVLMGRHPKPQGISGPPTAGMPSGGPMGGPQNDPTQTANFQKTHKYTIELMKLLANVERMEESGKTPITPAQAKSLLKILQPLREQKSLEEDAARTAFAEVQDVLTDDQRTAISLLPEEPTVQQSAPPQGTPTAGKPAGPPPGGGAKPMESFNPLNPPTGGPGGSQRPSGIQKLFNDLKSKSSKA